MTPRRARAAALGAVGFAVLGVLAGLGFVLTRSRPHIAADMAYHLSVLVVLLAALLALARTTSGASGAPGPHPAVSRTGKASTGDRESQPSGTDVAAEWAASRPGNQMAE